MRGTVKRQKGVSFSHTSNPASKLMAAWRNPLSADEILPITIRIKALLSSQMDALSSRFFSSPGRTLVGAELSGPSGLGDTLRDDTSGSPASFGGAADGGVSLSIISGRRSPEDELI